MSAASPQASEAGSSIALAERLHGEGRTLEAVQVLVDANRERHHPNIERRLVRLRHEAFAALDRSAPRGAWPPPVRDDVAHAGEPPDVPATELDLDLLRHGIFRHGCVLARGALPPDRVARLVEGIDRAFAGYEAHAAGAPVAETTPWYEPFKPGPGFTIGAKRKWSRASGGVLAADSPRVLFDLLDALDALGLRDLIAGFLGERPALSWNKSVLRRVETPDDADWHQDGAFLGPEIRSLNVWIALSHCGVDAPGIDVVPRRLDHVVSTGAGDASFSWSTSRSSVEHALAGADVWRPVFAPGDALFFDHLLLHRTTSDARMTRVRYATETWCFAPSVYPDRQVPIVF